MSEHREFPTLTPEQELIMQGYICPYCRKTTKYLPDSSEVYSGTDYGPVYYCAPCSAWVGCHKDEPQKAKGRLANKELRGLKIRVHAAFDPIWQQGHYSRKDAYKWLSEQLNIPPEFIHIGMFSTKTCLLAEKVCQGFINDKVPKQKTEDELRNDMMTAVGIARERIIAWSAGKKPAQGTVTCPVCSSKLNYVVAKNGHVSGSCTGASCLSWIE